MQDHIDVKLREAFIQPIKNEINSKKYANDNSPFIQIVIETIKSFEHSELTFAEDVNQFQALLGLHQESMSEHPFYRFLSNYLNSTPITEYACYAFLDNDLNESNVNNENSNLIARIDEVSVIDQVDLSKPAVNAHVVPLMKEENSMSDELIDTLIELLDVQADWREKFASFNIIEMMTNGKMKEWKEFYPKGLQEFQQSKEKDFKRQYAISLLMLEIYRRHAHEETSIAYQAMRFVGSWAKLTYSIGEKQQLMREAQNKLMEQYLKGFVIGHRDTGVFDVQPISPLWAGSSRDFLEVVCRFNDINLENSEIILNDFKMEAGEKWWEYAAPRQ